MSLRHVTKYWPASQLRYIIIRPISFGSYGGLSSSLCASLGRFGLSVVCALMLSSAKFLLIHSIIMGRLSVISTMQFVLSVISSWVTLLLITIFMTGA